MATINTRWTTQHDTLSCDNYLDIHRYVGSEAPPSTKGAGGGRAHLSFCEASIGRLKIPLTPLRVL